MDTIGFLNMGQKNILCVVGIYLEKAKASVEHFTKFPVTFWLFVPVVLGINGILTSIFVE